MFFLVDHNDGLAIPFQESDTTAKIGIITLDFPGSLVAPAVSDAEMEVNIEELSALLLPRFDIGHGMRVAVLGGRNDVALVAGSINVGYGTSQHLRDQRDTFGVR